MESRPRPYTVNILTHWKSDSARIARDNLHILFVFFRLKFQMYEIRTFDANEFDGQIWISETTETIVLQSGDVSVVSVIHTWPYCQLWISKTTDTVSALSPFPRFIPGRVDCLVSPLVLLSLCMYMSVDPAYIFKFSYSVQMKFSS